MGGRGGSLGNGGVTFHQTFAGNNGYYHAINSRGDRVDIMKTSRGFEVTGQAFKAGGALLNPEFGKTLNDAKKIAKRRLK